MQRLFFALFMVLGLPASALTVTVTGELEGDIAFYYSHENGDTVIVSQDNPRLAEWEYAVLLDATTGSMDVVEEPYYKTETLLNARNCSGLLVPLCHQRVLKFNTPLEDWNFTFDTCSFDCGLIFSLRGYAIATDQLTPFGQLGESFSVRFDTVSVDFTSPTEMPLPASAGFLAFGLMGLLGLKRRARR